MNKCSQSIAACFGYWMINICTCSQVYPPTTTRFLSFDSANSTIVITAPQGGTLKPDNLPDRRDAGCYNALTDTCTYDLECSPTNRTKCRATVVSDMYAHRLAEELADRLATKLGGRHWRTVCCDKVLNLFIFLSDYSPTV